MNSSHSILVFSLIAIVIISNNIIDCHYYHNRNIKSVYSNNNDKDLSLIPLPDNIRDFLLQTDSPNMSQQQSHTNVNPIIKNDTNSMNKDMTFLLISTASKIYSIKISDLTNINNQNKNLRKNKQNIIYKENDNGKYWITDVFYVKSEDLIYVNVYNSTISTSDIFTLRYDSNSDEWIKTVLYRDQGYSLGKIER
jgi:hypothetical protein